MATITRKDRLCPNGIPRWVRVYDNEGETIDRYTVIYARQSDKAPGIATQYPYVGMSERPTHPQGFGQHGHSNNWPADYQKSKHTGNLLWPPKIGRKCHLGKRIRFEDLPAECQRVVMSDYKAYWNL